MTDAFIYDHVRTPRGRGRPDGALHEVSAIRLASRVLEALAERSRLDTALIDDVMLGCAQPVGEQGGNIGRAAVLNARYAESVAGQQVNRFCACALEAVNAGAAQIVAGAADAVSGGGVECMSRTIMGADIALDELERRNLGTALITLCAGNGLGIATLIERV
ncbi:MAG TPA: hypothetical protein VJS42_20320 [Steroidobacteraceae bacterium]|nr:hypothetical protein [Steroidobacteraceae bacterium]